MTSKVDPRNVRVKIFLLAVDHNIGIQMYHKGLTKTFMMVSNYKNPLVSMVYMKVFQRFKG